MSEPIACPRCGAVMNHHADKITYTDYGEQVNEFHQCRVCGDSVSRNADLPED